MESCGMYYDKTIFIGIACYNESDIVSTIENCLENAKYPDRLHFGIVLHYCDMEFPKIDFPNTKIIKLQYDALFGVCPARSMALNLYEQEDFYMQLDGHMKFDKNWDEYLVDQFYKIKKSGIEKPLITYYVPWWSENEDGSINEYEPVNNRPGSIMLYSEELGRVIPQQTSTIDVENWENDNIHFFEHHGFSAHFAFAEADFIKEVPPDPDYMFYGEEPTTALRAWTRGYRIFALRKATVWHKNKGVDVGYLHNKDRLVFHGVDDELARHHFEKARYGEHKAQLVLSGEILGFWGAPTLELYQQYVEACGFDFYDFYINNLEFEINRVLDISIALGYNREHLVESEERNV